MISTHFRWVAFFDGKAVSTKTGRVGFHIDLENYFLQDVSAAPWRWESVEQYFDNDTYLYFDRYYSF